MDGHWLWPPPPPPAPSLINDLVFLIYEQPLQMRVGAPYSPARPAHWLRPFLGRGLPPSAPVSHCGHRERQPGA